MAMNFSVKVVRDSTCVFGRKRRARPGELACHILRLCKISALNFRWKISGFGASLTVSKSAAGFHIGTDKSYGRLHWLAYRANYGAPGSTVVLLVESI
jgi:hypothetical protein